MSSFVIDVIDNVFQHPRHLVKVFIRDGVAINELAVTKLVGGTIRDPITNREIVWPSIYPNALNVKCYSHTADLCGGSFTYQGIKKERLRGPNAKEFSHHMINLFSSSTAARNKWHQDMLTAYPSVSETSWRSVEEMDSYDLKQMYGDPIRGTIT